jgi:hypothetical protein
LCGFSSAMMVESAALLRNKPQWHNVILDSHAFLHSVRS